MQENSSGPISRVSKSFHGGTKTDANVANLDVNGGLRRASEGVSHERPQFLTQLSQPANTSKLDAFSSYRKCSLTEMPSKSARFTTTRVDEAEHAASMRKHIDKK